MKIAGLEVKDVLSAARAAKKVLTGTPVKRLTPGFYFAKRNAAGGLEGLSCDEVARAVRSGACGCAVGQFVFAAPKKERAALARGYVRREPFPLPEPVRDFLVGLDKAFEADNEGDKRAGDAKRDALAFCTRIIREERAKRLADYSMDAQKVNQLYPVKA